MKTKLTSKTLVVGSIASYTNNHLKKTCLLLLVLFALMPSLTKAQTNTGSLVGIGMGACNTYTFYSTTSQPTIQPLNYGNQYYFCTGLNDDDISFAPQGTSWRVEIKSWYFSVIGSGSATLTGTDASYNALGPYVISGTDVLSTTDYTTIGGVDVCHFVLNGSYVTSTYYRRDNWKIDAP